MSKWCMVIASPPRLRLVKRKRELCEIKKGHRPLAVPAMSQAFSRIDGLSSITGDVLIALLRYSTWAVHITLLLLGGLAVTSYASMSSNGHNTCFGESQLQIRYLDTIAGARLSRVLQSYRYSSSKETVRRLRPHRCGGRAREIDNSCEKFEPLAGQFCFHWAAMDTLSSGNFVMASYLSNSDDISIFVTFPSEIEQRCPNHVE